MSKTAEDREKNTAEEQHETVEESVPQQQAENGEEQSVGASEVKEEQGSQDQEQSTSEAADTELSLEDALAKLAEAEKKAEESYQKQLRTQADFDNFRRRSRQEKEEAAKYASLPLVEQLLPALDNFERALSASKVDSADKDSIVQGIEMVFRQLEQVLQGSGLESIPTVGTAFDPNVHQAVMQEESADHEPGTVIEELQKGFKLKDRVIRPAMVKVSS
ncbi:molecular chaperone GrpE [Bacillus horti]|uniref:Protein GrpE n=1 Tax=Caldalkalibacillus horti TaxID=77523 RepID=A0ABT9W470_9BACI|nr:nucleotide exchange factor GrpE [Bacillus horti]MDQ0168031.1 molecular chaperone GrpE [Bacillus horti]